MLTDSIILDSYVTGSAVPVLLESNTVNNAVKIMEKRTIHAVIIVSNETIAGVFTTGDFLRRVVSNDLNPKNICLADVMTTNPIYFSPQASVKWAFEVCDSKKLSHILVADDNRKPLGIISKEKLAHDIYSDLQEKSEECLWLRNYINGEKYAVCT